MDTYRLTFNSSTNFALPVGIYDVLYRDAYYFGYVKNERPNISGFMNHLLPSLSDYQDDLHEKLLKYNNGDEEKTKAVERSIHNVYLSPFAFKDDAVVNVPFRISKEHYDEFILIHDVKLAHYDTDFTNFVRNLLTEYAIRNLSQREYLYAYRLLKDLEHSISNGNLCHFYGFVQKKSFVPIVIEVSPISRQNIIVGFDYETNECEFIKLVDVRSMVIDRKTKEFTERDYEVINSALLDFYKEEETECLD